MDRAIQINPEYPHAYVVRGSARGHAGDHRGAEQDFSKALELGLANATVYNNRGKARTALGDAEGAQADYAEAQRLLAQK